MRQYSLLTLGLAAVTACAQQPGTFEELGRYRGLGALVASAVASGPTESSERLYLSYLYIDHTIDIVAVDLETGEHRVFENPAQGESGARCVAVGPDGNLYFGTLPKAHLLKLDPKAGTLQDLGRPAPTEQYIWDVTIGSDGKVYGATYPQARLVRYDPASGKMEDLGRMDPVEQYARWIAASGDGFVYTGIGTVKANVAAFEIASGKSRRILPEAFQTASTARVYRGEDGAVYGYVGAQYFRLSGWNATPIDRQTAAPERARNRLRDGRVVTVDRQTIRVTRPATRESVEKRFAYEGNHLPLFRIGFGADGRLYGSSVLPIHLVRYDPESRAFPELGDLGGGEVYSFLAKDRYLLMAAYSALAPLMKFDTSKPFSGARDDPNPQLLTWTEVPSDWRPQAFIEGPGGKAYLGAVSSYGKLGGPLVEWDLDTGAVRKFDHVIQRSKRDHVGGLAEPAGRRHLGGRGRRKPANPDGSEAVSVGSGLAKEVV